MALKTCKECGKEISNTARRCPHCGAYHWSSGRLGCAIFILFFAGIGILPSIYHSCSETSKITQQQSKPSPEKIVIPLKHEELKTPKEYPDGIDKTVCKIVVPKIMKKRYSDVPLFAKGGKNPAFDIYLKEFKKCMDTRACYDKPRCEPKGDYTWENTDKLMKRKQ